ncbi:MAG: hypothetical protein JXA03_02760 [Bacteroidales bacterium]|nr:hypothetical protein [Bacteroidales bacterium]
MKTKISDILTIIILIAAFTACERDIPGGWTGFDCEKCYHDKPATGPLNAVLTINDENPYVPLVIYIGNMEDNDIEYVDTSWAEEYWVDVPVDKYYTMSAEYKRNGEKVIAVDGDKFKLKHSDNDCDEPCYYFKGGYFDLRLNDD